MSNLSAFGYIQERSEATPGLFNLPLSIISANIAALDSGLTSSSPSGNTFSFLTNIETTGGAHFQHLSIGSTPPSYVTTAAVTIAVNSNTSDYFYLTDSSGQRSSYVIGSRAGATGDGLNIWDASGATLIASFSKQSIQFYQSVIGPVFDQGGAVFNVRGYGARGDGLADDFISIRSAISAAQPTGGTVELGPVRYRISSALTIPFGVSIRGSGGSSEIFTTTAGIVLLDVSHPTANGNRYGTVRDIYINGNSVATIGLYVGLAQAREFTNLSIDSCINAALVLNGAQNCLFQNIIIQHSGGTAVTPGFNAECRINHGADGNVFIGLHTGGRGGGAHLLVVNNDTADPIPAAYAINGPQGNVFYGSLFEVGNNEFTPSIKTVLAMASGQNNCFVNCQFSGQTAIYVLSFYSGAGTPVAPAHNMFDNCQIVGNSTSTAIRSVSAINTKFWAPFLQNHQAFVEVDNQFLALRFDGASHHANTGTFWTSIGGGAQDTAMVGPIYNTIVEFDRTSFFTDGVATAPSVAFTNDRALGWFRSGASAMGLSSGQLQLPAGTALQPPIAFSSESSLGFYRSAASTIIMSYGTLGLSKLTVDGAINAGGTIAAIGGRIHLGAENGNDATFVYAGGETHYDYQGTLRLRTVTGGYVNALSINPTGVPVSQAIWAFPLSGVTGTALAPSYALGSDWSLGWYSSGISTMALSYGTLNLATQAVRLSMRTLATSSVTPSAANTNVATNEAVFTIGGASGASFCISSGGTTYIFSSTASAKNT